MRSRGGGTAGTDEGFQGGVEGQIKGGRRGREGVEGGNPRSGITADRQVATGGSCIDTAATRASTGRVGRNGKRVSIEVGLFDVSLTFRPFVVVGFRETAFKMP
jgi:hypothetical protein